MDRDRVVVAELIRPRGNRGELLARSLTDVPGRLESLKEARVRLANGQNRSVDIELAWQHKGEWVVKLAGVDSISMAEEFRSSDLWVPLAERGQLAEGCFFLSDLVGFELKNASDGTRVGVITGWQDYGGTPLMEIECRGRDVLVPFVKEHAQVDMQARSVRTGVSAELLEL